MKFSGGPEEGNCEGKAEGWWRFALIVGSPASLLFFCNSFPHSEDESIMSDLLCQRRNHLQVFSTSCWPHLARISPTLAFTWLRLTYRSCFLKVWNNSRGIVIVQRYIHIYPQAGDVWPGRHLRGIPSTIGWTCRHLWGRKRESVSCAFAFSGQLWQGLLWLLEWRLSDIRYPGPLLPVAAHLLGKCTNNTHPGLFLLVLWVSRLVWIVGYWGWDTLTEHINYSSGLLRSSEENRKGKQRCNMNGYEWGRYLYYRKYSVQSACVCLWLPKVGGSPSGLALGFPRRKGYNSARGSLKD